ncbi:hypothetical protein EU534_00865 [Candidatus Heimdallarchaeota archaeon]|nr:MAG: hypothetical protein EU534_00865 [Candidatus Heimdallarchaeota archaeon]
MRTRDIKKIAIISTLILGLILASYGSISVKAMTEIEQRTTKLSPNSNVLYMNNTDPVIDGDIESYEGEWENATVYTSTIGSIIVTSRVQANSTHLFIGISYTTTVFVGYNSTSNHTWLAIVFDNNFDDRIGTSNETADDAVAINYRQEGAQDVYINGSTIYSLVADDNVTGVENSIGATGYYLDDFNRFVVSVELAKELRSMDEAGKDMLIYTGETMRFLVILFQNHSAIYDWAIIGERNTAWYSFRLNPTYEYFTYEEDLFQKSVLTYMSASENTDEWNISVVNNIVKSYGFNNTLQRELYGYSFEYNQIKSYDLIIIAGKFTDLTLDDMEALRFYVASGGSLFIIGEVSEDETPLNTLLGNFGLQMYNSSLFSKDTGINSTLTVDSADIMNLPYLSDSTILTNQSVSSIYYDGLALNFTSDGITGEMEIQFQEGDVYANINATGDYYIDLDDDSAFNSSLDLELGNYAALQATVELQRGGKLIVAASADMFNASNILKEDNKHLFIRQFQYLLGLQHQLNYDNFEIEETAVNVGDAIYVEISVFGDNNSIINNLHVWIVVLELKADQNEADLVSLGDNEFYNGSIIPSNKIKANFIDISIRMHKRGYGYTETQLVEVFLNPLVGRPIELDIVALIIFLASLGLVALGSFATRKYKVKEEA